MSQEEDPRERNREERTQKLHRCSNAEDALCLKIRNWVPYGALARCEIKMLTIVHLFPALSLARHFLSDRSKKSRLTY